MTARIFTLVILFEYADLSYSKVHISPSLNVSCPQDPCLTLSQFADNVSTYSGRGNETNISLFFLPGNHSLDRELSLAHAEDFSMTKDAQDNGTVFIECVNLGRFDITETTFAAIKGLHFIGCGGNTVRQVDQFILEDTIFQGVEGGGTALVLIEVAVSGIVRSSFLFNADGTFEYHIELTGLEYILRYLHSLGDHEQSATLNTSETVPVGGALYTAFSNVTIVNSTFYSNRAVLFGAAIAGCFSNISIINSRFMYNKAGSTAYRFFWTSFKGFGVIMSYESDLFIDNSMFLYNSAEKGGVLSAHSGSLHVASSMFTNNKALFGGVMHTTNSKSSFSITNSTFTNNGIYIPHGISIKGGVMYISGSFFTIIDSFFINSAGSLGAVMHTNESSFNIINCTFTENGKSYAGGIMKTFGSSFSITNSTFTNNGALFGSGFGGIVWAYSSSFSITNNTFTNNSAVESGGVIFAIQSSFNVTNSTFTSNSAVGYSYSTHFGFGGVIHTEFESSFNIINSTFTNNSAAFRGGVMYVISESSFNITNSTFTNNSVTGMPSVDDPHAAFGGVMDIGESSFTIIKSTFTNSAAQTGGVMYVLKSSVCITNSTFSNNAGNYGSGVMHIYNVSSLNITSSLFTNNNAARDSGVIFTANSPFNIANSTFANNSAGHGAGVVKAIASSFNVITNSTFINNSALTESGGVIITYYSAYNIANSTFTNNTAATIGGVMDVSYECSFNITNSTFNNNSAAYVGGVLYSSIGSSFNIANSRFSFNAADDYGGVMFTTNSSTQIANSIFDHNLGSLHTFNSNLTFSGYSKFENCATPPKRVQVVLTRPEGGAITSYQSTVIFIGVSSLLNNQARYGGAILAAESTIIMHSETTIGNNLATNSGGGGIYLHQSILHIKGNCKISHNHAIRGGGIHASSSSIIVYQPGTLQLINNSAEDGGGLYLEIQARLYLLKFIHTHKQSQILMFTGNYAKYGGAVYIADSTNSGACSSNVECFIQSLSLHLQTSESGDNSNAVSADYQTVDLEYSFITESIFFSENTATEHGSNNLFGGLLDRCTPSLFAEVYQRNNVYYNGVTYLENISNITLDSIASQPVRVCFCKNEGWPDCSHQLPPIRVKKGETFTVSLVAVDQVNHSVDASISSSLTSPDGGFGEGQLTQKVNRNCTDLTYNVFTSDESETMMIYADGPCNSYAPSVRHVKIQFLNCTCPVGFEPRVTNSKSTNCECKCHSALSPYITDCNYTTRSLLRNNTNSWITYINDTDPPGYVIHSYCPFDYCRPLTEKVIINLNHPSGADAQCAYNRTGVLCGACQENLSLSLGSSRCIPCHSHWPALLAAILLATILAGILLVSALLALNMTVAIGLINGIVIYANIIAASTTIFFPSSEPSFPTVFVSWLNLDIGIDVCFFDGLDAYTKTWLQLTFPVYIIFLVVLVIIVSEYSSRFSGLIGKRDPLATLATLILLSYAKLLSVTIAALSFAVLRYPDGSQEIVWLPDGNVKYFQGKHVTLVIMAVFIILIGIPYTIIIFLWQWLVRAPKWKVFQWTRNTKLNAFISTYHAPYNSKHRYWTGLLLIVRVVLYITAAVTSSANPQTSLLMTSVLFGGLILLKGIVYNKAPVDIVDMAMYFNINVLAVFSLYDFKTDITKQTAIAYTSTTIAFILLVGVVIYHVTLLTKKDKTSEENDYHPLAPVQLNSGVTHTDVEISNLQCPPPEHSSNETFQESVIN